MKGGNDFVGVHSLNVVLISMFCVYVCPFPVLIFTFDTLTPSPLHVVGDDFCSVEVISLAGRRKEKEKAWAAAAAAAAA